MELHVGLMELCVLQVLTRMTRLVSVTINAYQVSIGMEHAVFHRHPPVHQVSNGMGQLV